MKISVIIPVYNGGAKFRRCLESLANCIDDDSEVIVVADGESDGSWRWASEFGAYVIKLPVNGGAAKARNTGAAKANGDILFFIDADVALPPAALVRIRTAFIDEPGISAIIGSYDDNPQELNFLSQYRNLLHHYVHQQAQEDASTFWGACGAIRRSVFWAIGGFDQSYPGATIEDIELGYRLKQRGYRIRMVKDLQVKHLKYWEASSLIRTDIFCRALPWARLILNNSKMINDLNLKVSQRVSLVTAYIMVLTLICALFKPGLLIGVSAFGAILVLLNWDLYMFFRQKRGLAFSLRAILWHWFYYLYSGLGFGMALIENLRKKRTACCK